MAWAKVAISVPMEIYEIRPMQCGRVGLTSPLGIVDCLELDTAREAALHAQYCAQDNEAVLRLYNADGTVTNERPIPPPKSNDPAMGHGARSQWF